MFSAEVSSTGDGRFLRRRVLIATVVAVVAVAACFLIADAAAAELSVRLGDAAPVPVPLGAALFATAVAGFGAWLLSLLARRTSRPRRTFLLATLVGLLVTAIPPLQAAVNAETAIWLLALHAVAALVLIPSVTTALPAVGPAPRKREKSAGPPLPIGRRATEGHR